MSNLTHLPADIAAAISKYDADVKSGVIEFDSEGRTTNYPGKEEADNSLREFVNRRMPLPYRS